LLGTVGTASTTATADAGDPFGSPQLIQELFDPQVEHEDPSLTADELELFFREVSGTADEIMVSKRASVLDLWGTPVPVAELSVDGSRDDGPEISADGKTMWFASDRPGTILNADLWMATRPSRTEPWSVPVDVAELNSTEWESDPDVDPSQLSILFTTGRLAPPDLFIYAASRSTVSEAWGAPSPAAWSDGVRPAWDPCLIENGLTLFFAAKRDGAPATDLGDLFVASRPSVGAPFGPRALLNELYDPDATDQDPWVSADGRHIVFTSARGGNNQLYQARR
jgi:Tol biopolymer transport system component